MRGSVALPRWGERAADSSPAIANVGFPHEAFCRHDAPVPIAEVLLRSASSFDQTELYTLLRDLAVENESEFSPDCIPVETLARGRRWFASPMAHIQRLLAANSTLRKASLIVNWLESTHGVPVVAALSERPYVTVFHHLRRGELLAAETLAFHSGDHCLSGLCKAAQTISCDEKWQANTAQAPLFGEFARSQCTSPGLSTDVNQVIQLHERLFMLTGDAQDPFEKAIFGSLCGEREFALAVFGQGASWQDILWVELRCLLNQAFTYAMLDTSEFHNADVASRIQRNLGISDRENWEDRVAELVVERTSDVLSNCRPASVVAWVVRAVLDPVFARNTPPHVVDSESRTAAVNSVLLLSLMQQQRATAPNVQASQHFLRALIQSLTSQESRFKRS